MKGQIVETLPVLFVEVPGFKGLPSGYSLRMAAHGAPVHGATDIAAALAMVKQGGPLGILVTNVADLELLETARRNHPKIETILLTCETMEQYSSALNGREDELLDHVIANRSVNSWTINELRVTVQKILRNDIFGIDKYLEPGTQIHHYPVQGSSDRERLNSAVMNFADQSKLGGYMSKLVYGICEELLMNAIYDAPTAAGILTYKDLPRTAPITLKPEECASLSFACDGHVFAIAVRDPFGAFDKTTFSRYLKKVMKKRDSEDLIDTKKGGAGLGLFKVLYSCHSLICNVRARQSTEVIALIDIFDQVRDFSKMARSIYYFHEP